MTLGWGRYSKYLPFAFTEQGVAMLSSILNSDSAIEVNIAIMRVFVRLREMMATHKELAVKLGELEGRMQEHDEQIVAIFEAIRQLMSPPETPRKRIGFEPNSERILLALLGVPPLRGGAHFPLSFLHRNGPFEGWGGGVAKKTPLAGLRDSESPNQ